jgi:hypothetical protein
LWLFFDLLFPNSGEIVVLSEFSWFHIARCGLAPSAEPSLFDDSGFGVEAGDFGFADYGVKGAGGTQL